MNLRPINVLPTLQPRIVGFNQKHEKQLLPTGIRKHSPVYRERKINNEDCEGVGKVHNKMGLDLDRKHYIKHETKPVEN